MQVLRHEEFSEGCKATCNGAFDNRWSKSMVGFGSEDTDFVFEIVYNYGVDKLYTHGTDFSSVSIDSKTNKIKNCPFPYKTDLQFDSLKNEVAKINLNCSNLEKTLQFWRDFLNLPTESNSIILSNVEYTFTEIDNFNRLESAGRTAFSAPRKYMEEIQALGKPLGYIHTDLVALDTPGKATVEVIILQDPDGHEVCIVGDEAFKELSVRDADAEKLYERFSTKYG